VNSADIKIKIFEAFNLPEAYGIDRNSPHYMTYMMDIYNTNVNASKTEYETVEIRVIDENPQRASDMCDSIIEFYNHKTGEMHSQKYVEVAEIAEVFNQQKKDELNKISEELQTLRNESQLISFENQVKEVTKGYMNMLAANGGRTTDGQVIKKQYERLTEKGIEVYTLELKFNKLTSIVDSLEMVQDIAILEANKEITYCHVVEAPMPADKKSYPVRWLIVALSLMSALFAGLVFFLILDYKKL
ncbi:MAG: hypothetical protein HQ541_07550, partial [Mariniphaga sp.]|nr:hypothetical protein [Mariniphaga sp.]